MCVEEGRVLSSGVLGGIDMFGMMMRMLTECCDIFLLYKRVAPLPVLAIF